MFTEGFDEEQGFLPFHAGQVVSVALERADFRVGQNRPVNRARAGGQTRRLEERRHLAVTEKLIRCCCHLRILVVSVCAVVNTFVTILDKKFSGLTLPTRNPQLTKGETMEKKLVPRTFRPWTKNQERLEIADKIGLNVSELINEVLDKHLKPEMERKATKIREALTAQVP